MHQHAKFRRNRLLRYSNLSFFSTRYNIHISSLCYNASVRLSVMEVHWRIIANLGFKFRSKFTAHARMHWHEGRDHHREEWRDHLTLC